MGALLHIMVLLLVTDSIYGIEENGHNEINVETLYNKYSEVEAEVSSFLMQTNSLIEEVEREESKFFSYLEKEEVYLRWKDMIQQGYCTHINFNMTDLKTSFKFEFMIMLTPLKEIIMEIEEIMTDTKLKLQGAMTDAYIVNSLCKLRSDYCSNKATQLLESTLIKSVCDVTGFCTSQSESNNINGNRKIEKRDSSWQSENFVCSDGNRIPMRWRCDGSPDCEGGSDENNCENACNEFESRCRNGICTWSFRFCDGKDDCGDGSDEENCPKVEEPPRPSSRSVIMSDRLFPCRNGGRIDIKDVCDGVDDCGDGSDEECLSAKSTTTELPATCSQSQFQCVRDGFCIDKSQVCDGIVNCRDGSDEVCQDGCSGRACQPCTFEEGFFSCSQCLQLQKVCDGTADCLDGSDETPNCDSTVKCTANCTELGGVCFRHPTGPLCLRYCPANYTNVNGECVLRNEQKVGNSVVQLLEKATQSTSNLLSGFRILKYQTRQILHQLSQDLNNCANRPKYHRNIINV